MLEILKENGKCKVKITEDKYGASLLTTQNGYQWGAVNIDKETIELILEAITEYEDMAEMERMKAWQDSNK